MRRNRQHRDGEEEKSVFEKIAAMIADQLGIDASTIQPESRLIEDIKADSLDVVARVMEM